MKYSVQALPEIQVTAIGTLVRTSGIIGIVTATLKGQARVTALTDYSSKNMVIEPGHSIVVDLSSITTFTASITLSN